MQLQVGKKYRTREGKIATVTGRSDDPGYPFRAVLDGTPICYTARGTFWDRIGSTSMDLIEEISEDSVSNKAKRINDKIEAIPGVCQDGKKAIRALLEEVTGEKLTQQDRVPKLGEVWSYSGYGPGVVVRIGNNWAIAFLTVTNGCTTAISDYKDPEDMVKSAGGYLKFEADTVGKFLAAGGKL